MFMVQYLVMNGDSHFQCRFALSLPTLYLRIRRDTIIHGLPFSVCLRPDVLLRETGVCESRSVVVNQRLGLRFDTFELVVVLARLTHEEVCHPLHHVHGIRAVRNSLLRIPLKGVLFWVPLCAVCVAGTRRRMRILVQQQPELELSYFASQAQAVTRAHELRCSREWFGRGWQSTSSGVQNG